MPSPPTNVHGKLEGGIGLTVPPPPNAPPSADWVGFFLREFGPPPHRGRRVGPGPPPPGDRRGKGPPCAFLIVYALWVATHAKFVDPNSWSGNIPQNALSIGG